MSQNEFIESLKSGQLSIDEVIEAVMKCGSAEKKILAAKVLGVDPNRVIQEMFMGYKQRKQRKQLYGVDENIPKDLISLYYELGDRMPFESLKNAFVTKYIKEESKLEGVHSLEEEDGLRIMYEYIHSEKINNSFSIYTLILLHKQLYSNNKLNPDYGGTIRNISVFLPGTGTEISDYSMIFIELAKLDDEVKLLWDLSHHIYDCHDAKAMFDYLDRVVVLGCKIIKVHPFFDGNGRTVRGFMNKLLESAGLPPIYIKANERTEYHMAMNKANNYGDYSDIIKFYYYKVCDSIVELDINSRVKRQLVNKDDGNEKALSKIKK